MAVDESVYSIRAFSRLSLNQRKIQLYLEPGFAVNFSEFVPFTSGGLYFGAINHITRDLGIGLSGGVEMAKVVIDSLGIEDRKSYVVYPKVGVLGQFKY